MADVKRKKWKDVFVLEVYKLLRAGLPQIDVCRHLEVSKETFNQWQRKYPLLRAAIQMALKELEDTECFSDWVFRKLPPYLQKVWAKIEEWEDVPEGIAQIESMLADQGKRARQQLFLHALCVSRFSPSKAMQRTHISKKQLDAWIRDDFEFAQLVAEIQYHKGNFFEESLVRLVQEGCPAAVIFANKTYNRDRGYAPASRVDVSVSGSVVHGVLDLSELYPYLPESAKLQLLDAIRQKEAADARKLTAIPITPEEVLSEQIADMGSDK